MKNALEKDEANVLWDYGPEVIDSLSGLTKTLKMRFGGENFAEKNRIESMNAYLQNVPHNGNKLQQWPRVPISCFNCSQPGHIASNCPMAAEQNNAGQTLQLLTVNWPIQHVRPISEKQVKMCIKVRYRSYELFALLDTGSDITIAGRDVADHCEWKLESRDIMPIKMANGEELIIDGIARVAIKVNGTSTEMDAFVTRDITGLILSID